MSLVGFACNARMMYAASGQESYEPNCSSFCGSRIKRLCAEHDCCESYTCLFQSSSDIQACQTFWRIPLSLPRPARHHTTGMFMLLIHGISPNLGLSVCLSVSFRFVSFRFVSFLFFSPFLPSSCEELSFSPYHASRTGGLQFVQCRWAWALSIVVNMR